MKKTDPDRMKEVLAVLAEIIRQVAILAQPFMPQSTAKILGQLGVSVYARGFEMVAGHTRLNSGHKIDKPEPVFPRFVEEERT